MQLSLSIYQILEYFLIYAFIGWIVEVAYHAIVTGKVINRGFLNGPVCPIYGFGMVGILAILENLSQKGFAEDTNVFGLFLFGMALATAVELFGGWILDKIFHIRWWDYSNEKFNLHGYICLRFSLIWGFGAVFVIKFIHPLIRTAGASWIPQNVGWWMIGICYLILLYDLIITVMTLIGLNKKLDEIEKSRQNLRIISDGLSLKIADSAIETQNRISKVQVQAELGKEELKQKAGVRKAELTGKVKEIETGVQTRREETIEDLQTRKAGAEKKLEEMRAKYLKRHSIARRILRAFPDMDAHEHNELIEAMRKYMEMNEANTR